MHAIKRETADVRAKLVAELVANEPDEPWILWCDSDAEADALMVAVDGAVEVRGSHALDRKEAALDDFTQGRKPYLVSKPSICGWGSNWQHCARQAFIGRSFSYESWYQAVRRSWRFGQTRPVHVHLAVAEGEEQIGRVIDRKAQDHEAMKIAMAEAMRRSRATIAETMVPYRPTHIAEMPKWLTA
jgi:hypothetical protein